MLAVARTRPDHALVTWLDGDATALPAGRAELVVMTGHVAQVFLDGDAWAAALRAIRRALVPGGRLAFESRNPAVRAWERWNPVDSRRLIEDPRLGEVVAWHEVRRVGDTVTFDEHHLLADGEDLAYTNTLRFPGLDELDESLVGAGFVVEHRYGDWDRSPVTPTAPELILIARAG